MTLTEAIRCRRSVRTFDNNAVPQQVLENLMDFARNAENPYGIPVAWRLLDAAEEGLSSSVISGADLFIGGKVPKVPHAEEAFGYSFEMMVLYAQTRGLGTTWIAGTMDRPAFERAMQVEDGELMCCVSPLGYPADRMSIREALMRKGIKADSRMEFGDLFFDGSFDKPFTEETAGKLAPVLGLVRRAPSAVNYQPWRVVLKDGKAHFYEHQTKDYEAQYGWDLQKVDMGIALAHFQIGAQESGFKTAFSLDDPDIPAGDLKYIATFTAE